MTINNLYVTYDDEGTKHFHINDEEVTEDVWTQQHPHLKRGQDNGSTTNPDRGNVAVGDNGVEPGTPESQVRAGIRAQRVKAKAERAGSPGNGVGQSEKRPEQT